MRGSLTFLCAPLTSLLFLLLAQHDSVLAYPVSEVNDLYLDFQKRHPATQFQKRAINQCAQVLNAAGLPEVGTEKLRKVGGVPFIARNNCPNRGFNFRPNPGPNGRPNGAVVTLTTRLPADGKVLNTPPANTRRNCDHALEINMLLDTIEQSGGLCEQMNRANIPAATQDTLLEPLRVLINSQNNLNLVAPGVENHKNDMVADFRVFAAPQAANNRHVEALAACDYVEKLDNARTRGVADDLDAAIANIVASQNLNLATGLLTVRRFWDEFVDHAKSVDGLTLTEARRIQAQLKQAQQQQQAQTAANSAACGKPPGAGGAGGAGTGTVKLRMIKRRDWSRFASIFARQARGQARRNTAPAPSCPLPGTPPKRTVPASQVALKQPRANPRVVSPDAPRPAPRAAAPQKRPRPRPANRPRRVPGQPAPRPRAAGRTKPTRKPKAVPRPAGRAAGRPRGRRGRR